MSRRTSMLPSLTLAVFAVVFNLTNFNQAASFQQQDEEINVRGAFLTTRPQGEGGAKKSTTRPSARPPATRPGSTSGSRPRPPRTNNHNATAGTRPPKTNPTAPHNNSGASNVGIKNLTAPSGAVPPANNAPAGTIGLGYTLYMRDPVGDPVRVDPGSEFRAGDRIRLVLEPNIDGYLYVFHTENGAQPQMLFPDARLERGANAIRAHVPYEVPSSREVNEQLRWFAFDDKAAVEKLFIFVSREPLDGVPTSNELLSLCGANQQSCAAWRPSPEVWERLKVAADGPVQVSKSVSFVGKAQTKGEREATTRGLGLSAAAPEPSVVRMNVASSAGVLSATIDLVHK